MEEIRQTVVMSLPFLSKFFMFVISGKTSLGALLSSVYPKLAQQAFRRIGGSHTSARIYPNAYSAIMASVMPMMSALQNHGLS
jgi:hypothetical protein